jgi:hypothetical protein
MCRYGVSGWVEWTSNSGSERYRRPRASGSEQPLRTETTENRCEARNVSSVVLIANLLDGSSSTTSWIYRTSKEVSLNAQLRTDVWVPKISPTPVTSRYARVLSAV